MSLQWTLVATFLYTELGLCVLLMLPFISPSRWQRIFRSKLLGVFRSYANLYFNIFIVILVGLFIDALRDIRKYQNVHDELDSKTTTEHSHTTINMKLFRSQRNFFIAGMAMFLWLVIRRLVTLLSKQASLQADCEASMKQAQSASDMAKQMLEEKDNKGNEEKDVASKNEELDKAKEEVSKLKDDLQKANASVEAMKSQAKSTSNAYDDLLAEKDKLEKRVETLEGAEGSKKEE